MSSNPFEDALKVARIKRGWSAEEVVSEATPKADGADMIECPSCGHQFADYRTDDAAADTGDDSDDSDDDDGLTPEELEELDAKATPTLARLLAEADRKGRQNRF